MQDRIANNKESRISPELQEMLGNLVIDVVEKNQAFNSQKKWIKKYASIEGLDAEQLVSNLENYFNEISKNNIDNEKIRELGEAVYITDNQIKLTVEKVIDKRHKIAEEEQRKQEQKRKEKQKKIILNILKWVGITSAVVFVIFLLFQFIIIPIVVWIVEHIWWIIAGIIIVGIIAIKAR